MTCRAWPINALGHVQHQVLTALATGKRMHAVTLAAMTGASVITIRVGIMRLRRRGFVFCSGGYGQASKGYRLLHDPRRAVSTVSTSSQGAGRA